MNQTNITVDGGEYGWYGKPLVSFYDKLNYLWQAILDCYYDDENEINNWKERIREFIGKNVEFKQYSDDENGYYYNSIDHGYLLIDLLELFKEDENYLYNYLFNDESCVVLQGEECDSEQMKLMYPESGDYIIFKKSN